MRAEERLARKIAAWKLRLAKDRDGESLPIHVWQRCLPSAQRELSGDPPSKEDYALEARHLFYAHMIWCAERLRDFSEEVRSDYRITIIARSQRGNDDTIVLEQDTLDGILNALGFWFEKEVEVRDSAPASPFLGGV